MLGLKQVHHIAIIATDYAVSKAFYCDILGVTLHSEVYREERDSWKGDLALNGQYVIELFSFPFPPERPSRPEACGLRHGVKRNCITCKNARETDKNGGHPAVSRCARAAAMRQSKGAWQRPLPGGFRRRMPPAQADPRRRGCFYSCGFFSSAAR